MTQTDFVGRLTHFLRRSAIRRDFTSALGYSSPNDFEELQARDQEEPSRQTLLTSRVQSQGCTPEDRLRAKIDVETPVKRSISRVMRAKRRLGQTQAW